MAALRRERPFPLLKQRSLSERTDSTQYTLSLPSHGAFAPSAGHVSARRLRYESMWSAAMDVGGWLRSLGLGQYEANFRDNKIDADVLPQLTADDLKDIGVSAVGDRRRLLAAIAALSGPTPSANAPASSPKPALAEGFQISAERRPITVMFCDLVGSTSLAARLDAEDWRNLVGAYLDAASAAVTDFGGHVLKKTRRR